MPTVRGLPVGMKNRAIVWLLLAGFLAAVFGLFLYLRRPVEYRSEQFLMDTFVSIRVYGRDREKLREAVTAAFTEMRRIAELSNRFPPTGTAEHRTSDVCRINDMAGVGAVRVDQDVFSMLESARAFHDLTGGAFDVTVGPVMDLWGFGGKKPHVPKAGNIQDALALVDNARLILDRKERTAFLEKAGMSLDLGAVAKGYATERAVLALKRSGVEKALIDAGGNIRVLGKSAGNNPWRIGIKNPSREGDILAVLSLEDSAAVTSGDYYRYFESGGIRWHHIIDPRTGYPARGSRSVTVVAKDAGPADVLSTALFVLGPEKALETGKKLGVEVIIVTADGRLLYTLGIRNRLEVLDSARHRHDQG